jgi:tRNA pseudouridine55 synthase
MVASADMIQQATIADGVLVVMKEAGWTSHDVVAKLRGLMGGMKVGHAGTLDPAATGVLPVLVGRATRVAEYLVEWDKEYRAVMRLGETTDTQDATGSVLTRAHVSPIQHETLLDVLSCFRGRQLQLPPMYSAVKVGGRPLYKAARAGQTIERQERSIDIHTLELLSIEGRDVTMRVVCSKGTYVRTLCADIGDALDVGAHLLTLERRRVGPLSIDDALTVRQIGECLAAGRLRDHLATIDHTLASLPAVVVTDEDAQRILHGGAVCPLGAQAFRSLSEPVLIRLQDRSGRLLAIGKYDPLTDGPVKVHKMLVDVKSLN